MRTCDHWIQKCFELGRIWGLDLDGLRINQVCEFYSSGFDLLGLEVTFPTLTPRSANELDFCVLCVVEYFCREWTRYFGSQTPCDSWHENQLYYQSQEGKRN